MPKPISTPELQQVAMTIILNAGDARNLIVQGFQTLAQKNYVAVTDLLTQAQLLITKAHRSHTEILQLEANDIKIPYSVLFNHAQDTLISVQSEQLILKQLLLLTETLVKEELYHDESSD